MKTISEKTFGTRIANAKALVGYLSTFTAYIAPSPEQEITNLQLLIDKIDDANQAEATALQTYYDKTDLRQKAYHLAPDSLVKTLPLITGAVRAQYGKDSRQYQSIAAYIKLIRGDNQAQRASKTPDEKRISHAQTSFASLTQHISDMQRALAALSPAYNPVNASINSAGIANLLSRLIDTNSPVTTAIANLKTARASRNTLYDSLNAHCQRVKDAVKAQFGLRSTEYSLLKGLTI